MANIFKRNLNFSKICSVFTALCFIISVLGSNVYAINGRNVQPESKYDKIFEQSDSVINPEYGKITSAKDAGSDITVVNIQDLHCHPQTQRDISEIIREIHDNYKLSAVYAEGGYGDIETKWVNLIPDAGLREKTVNKLLEDGIITGAEYYAISAGKDGLLKGIDDKALHQENIKRLSRIMNNRHKYEEVLSKVEKEIGVLKNQYANKRNLRFNENVEKYLKGKTDSRKFYRQLLKYVKDINKNPQKYNNVTPVNMQDYPNICKFLLMSKDSREINAGQVKKELQSLVNVIKGKIPYSVYSRFIRETDNFSDSQKVIELLCALCSEEGIDIESDFAELKKFFEINEINSKFNPVELVSEERRLIEQIRTALSYNVSEYEIMYICDFEKYFGDYLRYNLTSGDWKYFERSFDKFRRIYSKYAVVDRIKDIESDFADISRYYEINDERNGVFVENLLKNSNAQIISSEPRLSSGQILKQSKEVLIAVTGGFHSEELKELLSRKNINTIVITPAINTDTKKANARYGQIIQKQNKILSQALAYQLASCVSDSEQKKLLLETAASLAGKENFDRLKQMFAGDTAVSEPETTAGGDIAYGKNAAGKIIDESVSLLLNSVPSKGMSEILRPDIDSIILSICSALYDNGIYFGKGPVFEIEESKYKGKDLAGIPAEVYSRMSAGLQKALLKYEISKNNSGSGSAVAELTEEQYLAEYRQSFTMDASAAVEILFSLDNRVRDYVQDFNEKEDIELFLLNYREDGKTNNFNEILSEMLSKYYDELVLLRDSGERYFIDKLILLINNFDKIKNLSKDDFLDLIVLNRDSLNSIFKNASGASQIKKILRLGKKFYVDLNDAQSIKFRAITQYVSFGRDEYFRRLFNYNQNAVRFMLESNIDASFIEEIIAGDDKTSGGQVLVRLLTLFLNLQRLNIKKAAVENNYLALRIFNAKQFNAILSASKIDYLADEKNLIARYYAAIAAARFIYDSIGTEINLADNINFNKIVERATIKYLEILDSVNKVSLIDKDTSVLGICNDEIDINSETKKVSERFNSQAVKEILKYVKGRKKESRLKIFNRNEDAGSAEKWLSSIKTFGARDRTLKNKGYFFFRGYGNKEYLEISNSKNNRKYRDKIIYAGTGETPELITVSELADALTYAATRKNNPVDLRNITIDLSCCESYYFARNIYFLLKERGLNSFPTILSAAGLETELGYTLDGAPGVDARTGNLHAGIISGLRAEGYEYVTVGDLSLDVIARIESQMAFSNMTMFSSFYDEAFLKGIERAKTEIKSLYNGSKLAGSLYSAENAGGNVLRADYVRNFASKEIKILPKPVVEVSIFSPLKIKSKLFSALDKAAPVWEETLFRVIPALITLINPIVGIPLFLLMQPLFLFSHTIVKWTVRKDSGGDKQTFGESVKRDIKNLLFPSVGLTIPYIISIALSIASPVIIPIVASAAVVAGVTTHYVYNKLNAGSEKRLNIFSAMEDYSQEDTISDRISILWGRIVATKDRLRDHEENIPPLEFVQSEELIWRKKQSLKQIKSLQTELKLSDGDIIKMGKFIDKLNGFQKYFDLINEYKEKIDDLRFEIGKMKGREFLKYTKMLNRIEKEFISLLEQEFADFLSQIYDDEFTRVHAVDVAGYSKIIAANMLVQDLGNAFDFQYSLIISAILHDVGKCFVPDEILNSKNKLSDDEMDVVRTHVFIGGLLLDGSIFKDFSFAAKEHHFRYNGKGYTYGSVSDKLSGVKQSDPLSGVIRAKREAKRIMLESFIIAVADVYDAIVSERSYKKAQPPEIAFSEIVGKTQEELLDGLKNGRETFFQQDYAFDVRAVRAFISAKLRNGIPEDSQMSNRTKASIFDPLKNKNKFFSILSKTAPVWEEALFRAVPVIVTLINPVIGIPLFFAMQPLFLFSHTIVSWLVRKDSAGMKQSFAVTAKQTLKNLSMPSVILSVPYLALMALSLINPLTLPAVLIPAVIAVLVHVYINEKRDLSGILKQIGFEEELNKTGIDKNFIKRAGENGAKFISVYELFPRINDLKKQPKISKTGIEKNRSAANTVRSPVSRKLLEEEKRENNVYVENSLGFSLGLTNCQIFKNKKINLIRTISESANLTPWERGYEYFFGPEYYLAPENYLAKLGQMCLEYNKQIFFFLPGDLYGRGLPSKTRAELEWLAQHPEVLKYVTFVTGAYDCFNIKDERIYEKYFNERRISATLKKLLSKPSRYVENKMSAFKRMFTASLSGFYNQRGKTKASIFYPLQEENKLFHILDFTAPVWEEIFFRFVPWLVLFANPAVGIPLLILMQPLFVFLHFAVKWISQKSPEERKEYKDSFEEDLINLSFATVLLTLINGLSLDISLVLGIWGCPVILLPLLILIPSLAHEYFNNKDIDEENFLEKIRIKPKSAAQKLFRVKESALQNPSVTEQEIDEIFQLAEKCLSEKQYVANKLQIIETLLENLKVFKKYENEIYGFAKEFLPQTKNYYYKKRVIYFLVSQISVFSGRESEIFGFAKEGVNKIRESDDKGEIIISLINGIDAFPEYKDEIYGLSKEFIDKNRNFEYCAMITEDLINKINSFQENKDEIFEFAKKIINYKRLGFLQKIRIVNALFDNINAFQNHAGEIFYLLELLWEFPEREKYGQFDFSKKIPDNINIFQTEIDKILDFIKKYSQGEFLMNLLDAAAEIQSGVRSKIFNSALKFTEETEKYYSVRVLIKLIDNAGKFLESEQTALIDSIKNSENAGDSSVLDALIYNADKFGEREKIEILNFVRAFFAAQKMNYEKKELLLSLIGNADKFKQHQEEIIVFAQEYNFLWKLVKRIGNFKDNVRNEFFESIRGKSVVSRKTVMGLYTYTDLVRNIEGFPADQIKDDYSCFFIKNMPAYQNGVFEILKRINEYNSTAILQLGQLKTQKDIEEIGKIVQEMINCAAAVNKIHAARLQSVFNAFMSGGVGIDGQSALHGYNIDSIDASDMTLNDLINVIHQTILFDFQNLTKHGNVYLSTKDIDLFAQNYSLNGYINPEINKILKILDHIYEAQPYGISSVAFDEENLMIILPLGAHSATILINFGNLNKAVNTIFYDEADIPENAERRKCVLEILRGFGFRVKEANLTLEAKIDKDTGLNENTDIAGIVEKLLKMYVEIICVNSYSHKHSSEYSGAFTLRHLLGLEDIKPINQKEFYYGTKSEFRKLNSKASSLFNTKQNLNGILAKLGLPEIPQEEESYRAEDAGLDIVGQLVINKYFNEVIERAFLEKKIIIGSDGKLIKNPEYDPFADLFADVTKEGTFKSEESLIRQAGVIDQICKTNPGALRLQTLQTVGSLLLEDGYMKLPDGRYLYVRVLKNSVNNMIRYGYGEIVALTERELTNAAQLSDILKSEGYEISPVREKSIQEKERYRRELHTAAADSDNPSAECEIMANSSESSVVGKVIFDSDKIEKIPNGIKHILFKQYTTPDDMEAMLKAAAIVVTGGNETSHAGLTAKEKGILTSISPVLQLRTENGKTSARLTYNVPSGLGSVKRNIIRRETKERTVEITEGSIIGIDGTGKRIIVFENSFTDGGGNAVISAEKLQEYIDSCDIEALKHLLSENFDNDVRRRIIEYIYYQSGSVPEEQRVITRVLRSIKEDKDISPAIKEKVEIKIQELKKTSPYKYKQKTIRGEAASVPSVLENQELKENPDMRDEICGFDKVSAAGTYGTKATNLRDLFNMIEQMKKDLKIDGVAVPYGIMIGMGTFISVLAKKNENFLKLHRKYMNAVAAGDAELAKETAENIIEIINSFNHEDLKELTENIEKEIREAIDKGYISEEDKFAVRSAFIGEDGRKFASAGIGQTEVGVEEADIAETLIKTVLSSLYRGRSTEYQSSNKYPFSPAALVQQAVDSEKSGVMLVRGGKVLITASLGQGEIVVSGEKTQSAVDVSIDGDMVKITDYTVEKQNYKYGFKGQVQEVETKDSSREILDCGQIEMLAKVGRYLRDKYGYQADIEFAFRNGVLYILQIRPVTDMAVEEKTDEKEYVPAQDELVAVSLADTGKSYMGVEALVTTPDGKVYEISVMGNHIDLNVENGQRYYFPLNSNYVERKLGIRAEIDIENRLVRIVKTSSFKEGTAIDILKYKDEPQTLHDSNAVFSSNELEALFSDTGTNGFVDIYLDDSIEIVREQIKNAANSDKLIVFHIFRKTADTLSLTPSQLYDRYKKAYDLILAPGLGKCFPRINETERITRFGSDFFFAEMVKNALVHGNAGNLEEPIAVHIKLNGDGRIGTLSVYNLVNDSRAGPEVETLIAASLLTGDHKASEIMGNNPLRDYSSRQITVNGIKFYKANSFLLPEVSLRGIYWEKEYSSGFFTLQTNSTIQKLYEAGFNKYLKQYLKKHNKKESELTADEINGLKEKAAEYRYSLGGLAKGVFFESLSLFSKDFIKSHDDMPVWMKIAVWTIRVLSVAVGMTVAALTFSFVPLAGAALTLIISAAFGVAGTVTAGFVIHLLWNISVVAFGKKEKLLQAKRVIISKNPKRKIKIDSDSVKIDEELIKQIPGLYEIIKDDAWKEIPAKVYNSILKALTDPENFTPNDSRIIHEYINYQQNVIRREEKRKLKDHRIMLENERLEKEIDNLEGITYELEEKKEEISRLETELGIISELKRELNKKMRKAKTVEERNSCDEDLEYLDKQMADIIEGIKNAGFVGIINVSGKFEDVADGCSKAIKFLLENNSKEHYICTEGIKADKSAQNELIKTKATKRISEEQKKREGTVKAFSKLYAYATFYEYMRKNGIDKPINETEIETADGHKINIERWVHICDGHSILTNGNEIEGRGRYPNSTVALKSAITLDFLTNGKTLKQIISKPDVKIGRPVHDERICIYIKRIGKKVYVYVENDNTHTVKTVYVIDSDLYEADADGCILEAIDTKNKKQLEKDFEKHSGKYKIEMMVNEDGEIRGKSSKQKGHFFSVGRSQITYENGKFVFKSIDSIKTVALMCAQKEISYEDGQELLDAAAILPENLGMLNENLREGKSILETALGIAIAELKDSLSKFFVQRHNTAAGKKGAAQLQMWTKGGFIVSVAAGAIIAASLPLLSGLLLGLISAVVITLGTDIVAHTIIDYKYIKSTGLREAVKTFGAAVWLDENGQIHVPPVLIIEDIENVAGKYELINTGLKVNDSSVFRIGVNGILAVGAKNISSAETARILSESGLLKTELQKQLRRKGQKINLIIDSVAVSAGSDALEFEGGIITVGENQLLNKTDAEINKYISSLVEIKRAISVMYSQKTIVSLETVTDTDRLFEMLKDGKTRKVITAWQYEQLKIRFESEGKNTADEIFNLRRRGIEIYIKAQTKDINDTYVREGLSGQLFGSEIYDYFSNESFTVETIKQKISVKELESMIVNSDKPLLIDIQVLREMFYTERDITRIYSGLGALLGSIKLKFGIGNITALDMLGTAYGIDINKVPVLQKTLNREEFLKAEPEQLSVMLNLDGNDEISIILNDSSVKEEIKSVFVRAIKERVLCKTALKDNYKEFGLKDKKLEMTLGKMLVKQSGNEDKTGKFAIEYKNEREMNKYIRELIELADNSEAGNVSERERAVNTIIEIILVYADEYKNRQMPNTLEQNDARAYRSMLSAA